MPRAVLTDENDVPKRAPRKRVAKVSEDGQAPAPRKRAPRKKKIEESAPIVEEVVSVPKRKAPTPLAADREKKVVTRKQGMIAFGVVLFGFVSSAVIGFSDPGKIDINNVITEINQQSTGNEGERVTIPVQNTSQEPDGGLIGLGIEPPVTVPSETASTTATTTEEVASTTPQANVPLTNEEAAANAQALENE